MQFLICTYDKKGEAFTNPVATPKKALAVRDFAEVCKDEKHPFHKYPEDYSMWTVGEFNEITGEITPKKEKIAEAINFVIKKDDKK